MAETSVWQQSQNTFTPGTTFLQTKILPPGIYEYTPTQSGWHLTAVQPRYTFPYKIYGHNDSIVQRISMAWNHINGNLGILLNGLKGTGKTITAQMVANWAIDQGIPVLAVGYPIPLADVLGSLEQPVMVIFDEFEKTHIRPEHQQQLLTALDGMARSKYKRLFCFTTNDKKVDVNLVDRPSRVRYCWEFQRLSEDVVEAVMQDLLDPELEDLRGATRNYLLTRDVLSIDVVKTVLTEVNIFKEDPSEFSEILNLTEAEPPSFTVEVLAPDGSVALMVSDYFRPTGATAAKLLNGALSKRGSKEQDLRIQNGEISLAFVSRDGDVYIIMKEATAIPNEWRCEMQIPSRLTWINKLPRAHERVGRERKWIDKGGEGFQIPVWAKQLQAQKELTGEETEAMDNWYSTSSVYGSYERALMTVRFTANKPNTYVSTTYGQNPLAM